ncbi:MAG: hypothetical protein E7536_04175 [Ruminococcaceae bacterium]|nr:hypothetical protein [Oscillospiraceae bacterium]
MKKIISLFLAFVMIMGSFAITSSAEEGEKVMKFGTDGKFRVMHVTDTHFEDYNADSSCWAIGYACDKEKPDIVVITGDNVQNCENPADTKRLIDKLMTVFEERNIPVAVTFGNHDSETGAMSREELMAYYNTYSCSVSVDDGEALSGCGTYNIPVMSSDGEKIKFNLWVFDSNDYDKDGHYSCVQADQVEWYKKTSDELKALNGGEKVYSLAFQHIIVPEIYDVLKKTDKKTLFAFDHMYNEGEYYYFDEAQKNYGTLNETPCSGYENFGQFDAMVEKGDVLAIFSGHDHANAFGVENQGIDIVNSLSTRYNNERYSTQYGYRMIVIDENDTSVYDTYAVHWYDMLTFKEALSVEDSYGKEIATKITFLGFFQKFFDNFYRTFARIVTGRQISYPDKY